MKHKTFIKEMDKICDKLQDEIEYAKVHNNKELMGEIIFVLNNMKEARQKTIEIQKREEK